MRDLSPFIGGVSYTLLKRIRSGSGLPQIPVITGLALTGVSAGIARIWSTVGYAATVTGTPDTTSRLWLLDGAPMQGATGTTMVVDPSFDGSALSFYLLVANGAGGDDADSLPATVAYPVPLTIGTIPAITGAVGDSVLIPLAPFFRDGNPNSLANTSLAYVATGLPSGLSIIDGAISGILAAPVTAQAFSITASNSGGSAVQNSTSTITGGAFLYNYDFNVAGSVPAEFLHTNNLMAEIVPDHPAAGTFGTIGAMRLFGPATNSSTYYRDYDVTNVADGTTFDFESAVFTSRVNPAAPTGFTSTAVFRWINAANAVVASEHLVALSVTSVGLKTLHDGVYQVTKPAGLSAVKLRFAMLVTNWTYGQIFLKHLRLSGGAVLPIISDISIAGSGLIGDVHTMTVITDPPASPVNLSWTRNGTPISGATAATYTPVSADDATALVGVAVPTAANAVAAESQPIAITYALPTVSALPTLTPESGEEGQVLTFTLGAATPNVTTSYTLDRDGTVVSSGSAGGTYTAAVAGAYRLVVTHQNSGGAVSRTVTSNITVPAATGQAIIVYDQSFTTDRSADFLAPAPASLVHASGAVFADDVTGAMVFGTYGANFETAVIRSAWTVGRIAEVYNIAVISGSGGNSMTRTVSFKNAGGTTLATYNLPSTNAGQFNTPAAPPNTAFCDVSFILRGLNNTSAVTPRKITIHYVGVADVTDSGPSPNYTARLPQSWADYGYTDRANPPVDFAMSFTGPITHYSYEGPEVHSWAGSVLTITPNAVVSPSVKRRVRAHNGALASRGFSSLWVNVQAAAPTISLNPAVIMPTVFRVEVNRPIAVMDPAYYVTGGAKPFTYSVVSGKPSWVTVEDFGTAWGIAPATAQTLSNMTIRVTDARGQFVDVVFPIEVIATRSRTPYATIAPTLDLKTAIGANKLAGRVFQLQAGTYAMGNWYQFFQGTPEDPMIIRGVGPTTIMSGQSTFNGSGGVLFENMRFTRLTAPEKESDATLSFRKSFDMTIYDCEIEAYQQTLTRGDIDAVAATNPYQTADMFVYSGGGIHVSGVRCTMDKCTVSKVREGVTANIGAGLCIARSVVSDIGDDGINIAQSEGVVIVNCRAAGYSGNHQETEHRDCSQSHGDHLPVPKRVVLQNNFYSGKGIPHLQGWFFTNAGQAGRADWRLDDAMNGWRVRDCIVLSGSNYGLSFSGMYDAQFSRIVAINHPDYTGGLIGTIDHKLASKASITGAVYESLTGGAQDTYLGNWSHLVTLTASVQTVGGGGATAYATIFPNWANTGLAYEDPREAVANGQPASAARFWINPAGAWSLANPNIAPSWLRTGAA